MNIHSMMRFIILLFTIELTACNSATQTDKLLARIWAADQGVRERMAALTKAVTVEGNTELIDSLITTSDEVQRIDTENMHTIDSILRQGLPQGLSHESYKTIWIVIDHGPIDKQVKYLPLIKQMADDGLVGYDEYATLFDRVAMKQNRPQRYGSQSVQFGRADAVELYIWPIENPAELDARRAEVGMTPFAEYLHQLAEVTGIEPKYDTTLSVEQIKSLRREATSD